MSNNDPTKWEYFESMRVVPFLQMCLYYRDKQKDLEQQRKLAERSRR